jgi:hypothetical protein
MNTERYPLRHASFWAVTVLLCAALASCSLSLAPGSITSAVSLRDGLGLSENEGWIVLSQTQFPLDCRYRHREAAGSRSEDLGTLENLGSRTISAR